MTNVMSKMGKYTDLIAAGVVVLVVVMIIIPLPPWLLDLLITLNISVALAIVVTTLYVPRALDFSVFPSLLLLTTLFRLAINICVTRLILLDGDAGHVVEAFGNFVVGGNVVVGLVIFLILIVIQFVVITNGAGRVAEVGARFTLDAMPGKQMAIDADLNAGQITEERGARAPQGDRRRGGLLRRDGRRLEVRQGRRDGRRPDHADQPHRRHRRSASRSRAAPFGEAVQHFSLLSIGDGLCAQIPALLISVATGIIVTRSATRGGPRPQVAGQIGAQRRRRWSPASSSASSR